MLLVRWLVARFADAGRSLGSGAFAAARGGWLTARRGARGAAAGAGGLLSRRRGSAATLGLGVARLLLQLPADALLLVLTRLVSAVQTLIGFEAAARRLDDDELALLRRLFGDGIDPRPVRLKVGRLGLLGLPRRAFVVGDTVHVPAPRRAAGARRAAAHGGSLARRASALLVHELVHVWQHQRHGTRYLSECLLAQWWGDGYNVAVALEAGRSWDELNFEQQAELFERAFAVGWFDCELDTDVSRDDRLLMKLTDPRRDDGFLVQLTASAAADERLATGWRDATPLLVEGLATIRGRR